MGGLEARACAGGSRPFVSVQCRALQCTRKSAPPHSAFFDQTRIQRAEREKKMNDGWWERGLCSAGRVWESNVIGPLLGLPQYNIFWVGGRGGVPVDVEGRGEMEGDHCQLSNLVRPRGFIVHPSKPPSPRHSQHYLSNLPCCCSPSPVPSPSRPPPPNHRAAHPNPIFRSRCCRPPTLPTFPLPPQQPSTEPRQIRPGRTCLPGPKPLQLRFPPGLFGRLPNAHHLPTVLDTSDQTTLPPVLLGCCCLAPGHRPPRPRRSNPRPDTTKNPYSLPGVASLRLQRHFFLFEIFEILSLF